MAVKWSWTWGAESIATLQSMGFNFESNSTNAIIPDNTYQYKSVNGPACYSLKSDGGIWFKPPTSVVSGNQGCASIAFYGDPTGSIGNQYTMITARDNNQNKSTYVQILAGGGVRLFVDSVYKASSASTWSWIGQWNVVTLKYNMSGDPWKAKVFINGVEAISEQTDARAAAADGDMEVYFESPFYGDRKGFIGPVILYSAYDDATPNRIVSRLAPDADVSETGTWTPDSGATNFARTAGEFNAAQYTEVTSPSNGDEVVTNYSANLTSKLGSAPPSVDCVTVHSWSTGLNNTARAEVGDQAGTATTVGTTTNISNTSTYASASATTKPSGGAWGGSDTPKCKYEVVSN